MNPQFLNIIRTQVKQVLGITDKNVLSRYMTAEAARQGKKNIALCPGSHTALKTPGEEWLRKGH